jgi:RNA polymerase sigma-70 factor (ECF subfamily)
MHPDVRLAELVIAGDVGAITTLVDTYYRPLWRKASILLHDSCKAEDAVQETFLKGLQRLPDYSGTGSLLGWFTQICHNHCLDELKRRSNREVPMDLEAIRPPEDARQNIGGHHTNGVGRPGKAADDGWEENVLLRLNLRNAFAALEPPKIRQAAELVLVRELTREEAAAVMRVPPSTMRTWVNRARRELSDRLSRGGDGEL